MRFLGVKTDAGGRAALAAGRYAGVRLILLLYMGNRHGVNRRAHWSLLRKVLLGYNFSGIYKKHVDIAEILCYNRPNKPLFVRYQ